MRIPILLFGIALLGSAHAGEMDAQQLVRAAMDHWRGLSDQRAIDLVDGPRRFVGHWVAEGLMLCNLPFAARHAEALRRQGVHTVLNMCRDSEYRGNQREELRAEALVASPVLGRDAMLLHAPWPQVQLSQ